jgi:signal transduction histidine kinase
VGISQLLIDTCLSEQQIELASTILNCGMTIQRMLNNVLDMSKIESGSRNVTFNPINVVTIINHVASLFQTFVVSKGEEKNFNSQFFLGLKLFVKIDEEFSQNSILTDELCVTQVLTNLISNSTKFTEKGFISISVSKTIINDSQWEVRLEVKGMYYA